MENTTDGKSSFFGGAIKGTLSSLAPWVIGGGLLYILYRKFAPNLEGFGDWLGGAGGAAGETVSNVVNSITDIFRGESMSLTEMQTYSDKQFEDGQADIISYLDRNPQVTEGLDTRIAMNGYGVDTRMTSDEYLEGSTGPLTSKYNQALFGSGPVAFANLLGGSENQGSVLTKSKGIVTTPDFSESAYRQRLLDAGFPTDGSNGSIDNAAKFLAETKGGSVDVIQRMVVSGKNNDIGNDGEYNFISVNSDGSFEQRGLINHQIVRSASEGGAVAANSKSESEYRAARAAKEAAGTSASVAKMEKALGSDSAEFKSWKKNYGSSSSSKSSSSKSFADRMVSAGVMH